MARRVTYLPGGPTSSPSPVLDAEARVLRSADATLDLRAAPGQDPAGPTQAQAVVARHRRRGRRWQRRLVSSAVVVVGLVAVTVGTDDRPPVEEAPVVLDRDAFSGPAPVSVAALADAPFRGTVTRHPADHDELAAVDRVHVVSFSDGSGSGQTGRGAAGIAVVDATRRARVRTPGDVDGGPIDAPLRLLGDPTGAGLRTLEWDAGAYGISLTTVGLDLDGSRALGAALRLPQGRSLRSGRPPQLSVESLGLLGLGVGSIASGPASTRGSPLIGQSGGDALEAYLYRVGGPSPGSLLVAGVADRLLTARVLLDALGTPVAVDASGIEGVTAAAGWTSEIGQLVGVRVTGRTRLLLDHHLGGTVELASDVLDLDELVEAARSIDLALVVDLSSGP